MQHLEDNCAVRPI